MRLCQPSPHVLEHTLHADHSSPDADSAGHSTAWDTRREGAAEPGRRRRRGEEGEEGEGPKLISMQEDPSTLKRRRGEKEGGLGRDGVAGSAGALWGVLGSFRVLEGLMAYLEHSLPSEVNALNLRYASQLFLAGFI